MIHCVVVVLIVVAQSFTINHFQHVLATPLDTCSDRFCVIKLCDLSGLSHLLINVYMPTDCGPTSYSDYLNVLGELEGFVHSQNCNVVIVAGDFNVDFDRGGQHAKLLDDFMAELKLYACDLNFRNVVGYTYEHDGGLIYLFMDRPHFMFTAQPYSRLCCTFRLKPFRSLPSVLSSQSPISVFVYYYARFISVYSNRSV